MNYAGFIAGKTRIDRPCGMEGKVDLHQSLFAWQKPLVQWALRRGRAILAEDCGLGKGIQLLNWSHNIHAHTNRDVLILAPLGVRAQLELESKKFGIEINLCRNQDQVKKGVNVTNYEMMHHFDPQHFAGVCGDELSCIKNETSATRNMMINYWQQTPFRLGCSATPAPNDYMELGNYCEFLGIMTRTEMLATYFTHDGGETSKWRLKGHAQDHFWRFVSSWMLCISKPSDIGFSDEGFALPELKEHWHVLEDTSEPQDGMLFKMPAATMSEQRGVKRATIKKRCEYVADLVSKEKTPCIVWGELNDECDLAEELIKDSVQVAGCESPEEKERKLVGFIQGDFDFLVSKASICGYGMNMQRCPRAVDLSITHSAEDRYQKKKRIHRYGQKNTCHYHNVMMDAEVNIKENMDRKDREAIEMRLEMQKHMAETIKAELGMTSRQHVPYEPTKKLELPSWIK